MSFWNLPQGLRVIPSEVTAADEPYSMALHSLIEHNEELIENTILTRQLVNDYYPDDSSLPHVEFATYAGMMMAQWGRFEHKDGMELVCKIHAAKRTVTWSYDTDIHLVSTPKFLSPLIPLEFVINSYASAGLHYDYVTIDSTTEQYWDLKIKPNARRGSHFYLSLWKASTEPTSPSEVYIRLASIWEQPEGS